MLKIFKSFRGFISIQNRGFCSSLKNTGYIVDQFTDENDSFSELFIVPDNEPSIELIYKTDNLRPISKYCNVEYTLNNNNEITSLNGIDGNDLYESNPNLRVPNNERTLRLSEMENGKIKRHIGNIVAVNEDTKTGYIIPKEMNYKIVRFDFNELQTTSYEKIDIGYEVEFYARNVFIMNSNENIDSGLCITRPGGGLITFDNDDIDRVKRRVLGEKYNYNDEYCDNISSNVKREIGYIFNYNKDKLRGAIMSFNDVTETLRFNIDNCHIFGKRMMGRFMMVEYTKVESFGEDIPTAIDITLPDKKVIHSISQNWYLPKELQTRSYMDLNDYNIDNRYKGVIMSVLNELKYLIKPNDIGYKPIIIANSNELKCIGRQYLRVGDHIEFSVDKYNDIFDQAINVTGHNGMKLVTDKGELGDYYRKKMTEEYVVKVAPLSKEYIGYIRDYNFRKLTGTIELIAPDNIRYSRASFEFRNCNINQNEIDQTRQINPIIGTKIKCTILCDRFVKKHKRRAVNISDFDGEYLTVGYGVPLTQEEMDQYYEHPKIMKVA